MKAPGASSLAGQDMRRKPDDIIRPRMLTSTILDTPPMLCQSRNPERQSALRAFDGCTRMGSPGILG
jgi:hypothetical protein